jgi:hypothetical protein
MRETYYSESARDECYKDLLDKLTGQRRAVFEAILHNGPVSDNRLSVITGIPVHIVVARRNELWGKEKQPNGRYEINTERQLIEFAGYDETRSPKQSLWKVSTKTETPTLF